MSSFMEKLKKGMKTEKAGIGTDETKEEKDEEYETENGEEDPGADETDEDEIENGEKDENSAEEEMNDDENEEEPVEEKPKKTIVARKTRKTESKTENKLEGLEVKAIPSGIEKEKAAEASGDGEWLETEGQLAVDVYQTVNELVIQAAIAGIKTEDLDVLIEEDVLTIKGKRANPYQIDAADYFIQECYWGPFSRKIILPVEVDASRTDAAMKEGILTIRIPKVQREKKKKVTIKG